PAAIHGPRSSRRGGRRRRRCAHGAGWDRRRRFAVVRNGCHRRWRCRPLAGAIARGPLRRHAGPAGIPATTASSMLRRPRSLDRPGTCGAHSWTLTLGAWTYSVHGSTDRRQACRTADRLLTLTARSAVISANYSVGETVRRGGVQVR